MGTSLPQGRQEETISDKEVTLRIEGSPRTKFSGVVCLLGNKEELIISGVVPKRYSYKLANGQKLNCEIQKQNADASILKVILIAGENNRSVQQTNASTGTITLTYSNNSISSSRKSSSSSSSSIVVISSCSSSSGSWSSSTSSR